MMAGHQQRSFRYPSLRVTVKHETDERLVTEIYSTRPKNNYHSTTIYYNSNHRQKQQFNRPPPSTTVQRRSQNYTHVHYSQQPIRPLMEINNHEINYCYIFQQREPKQHGQYRNRKAELDWDHAFDLDQINLYTKQNDSDNHSLTSINSSSDNSFSSV
jgi:hypothetical protein